MDERPNPPPGGPSDYGASENSEDPPPLAEEVRLDFDAVTEFTVPVELDKMNGAPAASPNSRTEFKLPRLKTAKEFVADFTPPDYLIDGILQRGYFYTLTAKTGHGKTAWGLLAGICTAAGIKLGERECRQGAVCFFAGENADDVRARLIAQLDHLGLDIDKVPIHFFDQIIGIREHADYIAGEVERIGGVSLIIIDSFATICARPARPVFSARQSHRARPGAPDQEPGPRQPAAAWWWRNRRRGRWQSTPLVRRLPNHRIALVRQAARSRLRARIIPDATLHLRRAVQRQGQLPLGGRGADDPRRH